MMLSFPIAFLVHDMEEILVQHKWMSAHKEDLAVQVGQGITIIGIPFGLQSLKLGMLAIWPFGTKVKWKPSQPGCLSIFMNVLWFFVGGIWIWLTHVFYGLIFCITIIGIPFGKMHFRLAKLALSPFGKELV